MKEKSSLLLRHKRRHRSSSCSSSGSRKASSKLNDSENSLQKHGRCTLRHKLRHKIQSEDFSDSSSVPDVERNVEKKRRKHTHHRRKDLKNSIGEEENCQISKSQTSQSHREGDRYRNKIEEGRSRPKEKENKSTRCNHKREQHLSSEYKSSDHNRQRERRYDDDGTGGRQRDDGSGGRHSEKGSGSADAERRMHKDDRYHERRDEEQSRRRDENYRKESNRRFHEGEDRRKRWPEGGEGSGAGGSRGFHSAGEMTHSTSYVHNRPIKQEPGVNDESENYEWGNRAAGGSGPGISIKKEKDADKDKPNFGLSGKLTEDTNMVNGVVIKYSEPPEARKPRRRWRLYVFKGEENLPTLYLHRQSAFLIGRDRKVVDIPVDHPSCSKQHAAFQFRLVPYERPNGTMGKRVRPYIIDLESSNGTFVNNNRIEAKKYVELLERDVMKFGFSSREYVLLHEQSKESEGEDDDVVGT